MTTPDNNNDSSSSSNQFFQCSVCLENLASPASTNLTTSATHPDFQIAPHPTNMPGANRSRQGQQVPVIPNNMPLNLTEVVTTKCGHLFHSVCLQEWYKKNKGQQTCPFCRMEIPVIDGTVRVYPCCSTTSQGNPSKIVSTKNDNIINAKEGAQEDDNFMKETVHNLLVKDMEQLLEKYHKMKEDEGLKEAQITSLQEDNNRKDNENMQLKRKIEELQNSQSDPGSAADGGSPNKRPHP